MAQALPDYDKLHSLLEEREPGILYWKVDRSSRGLAGTIAGYTGSNGYHIIAIDGYRFPRHRIIWKMHNKNDPVGILDHILGREYGDYIENLRDVTYGENSRDGRPMVSRSERQGRYNVYDILSFSVSIWPDEDIDDIERRLEEAIAPIVNELYEKRFSRNRPKKS